MWVFLFFFFEASAAAASRSKSAQGAKFNSRKIAEEGVCIDEAVWAKIISEYQAFFWRKN